ncbi:MAG: hypothetical protein GY732_07755, partial [Gammaproteobacteria bacterium]|nr:hypothetical protein [Gammaproteobacteria bacterium]
MAYCLLTSQVLYQTSKYAPVAVVHLELDIPNQTIPGFSPSLMNVALSEISECGAGGEILISGSGTPLENFCDLVLRLQRYAGHEVAWSRVDTHCADRGRRVFIEYEDHATALYAADLALDLVNTVLDNPDGLATNAISALQQQLNEYASFALERRLDPNTRLLKGAARQQDIPTISLDPPWGMPTWPGAAENTGITQYCWGINQRQCRGALPLGSLSSQQVKKCSDRAQLLSRLKNANLPIGGQDLEFINRNQIKRALRSARRIGYPVIIRPRFAAFPLYGLLDNGMFGPAENDEQVTLIVRYLTEQTGTDIWVESFVSGAHYRFLILDNEVVSVVRFIPPTIVGDGVQTVAGLAQTKAEATAGADSHRVWHLLAKGDDALLCRLQSRGMNLSSIPARGEAIKLRGEGTYYNGGTGIEVLEEVSPHFRAVALQAAIVFGLQRMAGIDLIIEDLQGIAEIPNCAVTGVDPVPDLVSHSKLSETNNQRVPAKFFSLLFPQGKASRIPTVSVTGTNGKTTTSRMIVRI